MGNVNDKLLQYADKIEALLVENAPEAYDALLRIVQVEAAHDLLLGVLFAASAIYAGSWGIKFYSLCLEEGGVINDYEVPTFFLSVLTVMFTIGAMICLLNIWNYIAFIDPDLALAHEVLQRFAE